MAVVWGWGAIATWTWQSLGLKCLELEESRVCIRTLLAVRSSDAAFGICKSLALRLGFGFRLAFQAKGGFRIGLAAIAL